MRYTVNSYTDASGRVVWSIKKDGFHNLLADVTSEKDARAVAAELNAIPDPTDIAYLAMGADAAWRGFGFPIPKTFDGLGQLHVFDDIITAAIPLLAAEWDNMDTDGWDGVWAYEVCEPLGSWIVRSWASEGTMPSDTRIIEQIRTLIRNV